MDSQVRMQITPSKRREIERLVRARKKAGFSSSIADVCRRALYRYLRQQKRKS